MPVAQVPAFATAVAALEAEQHPVADCIAPSAIVVVRIALVHYSSAHSSLAHWMWTVYSLALLQTVIGHAHHSSFNIPECCGRCASLEASSGQLFASVLSGAASLTC